MENAIFFRNDQMELMAEFLKALIFHNQRFRSETDAHGFHIILY